ncbi:hypothetical protein [Elizabethkingia meningoseptica]|uniref:hypothetical protein n=1 Tax=Elizabethkingia meningoseptica TaxID=238 RepID=UPI0016244203|nr:hypothetical protein [Elizabethkingia meningoseptica]
MANCFDNIRVENVNHCPNDEITAGLSTKLNYAPEPDVETLTLPTITDALSYEERITISNTGLVTKTGKGFKQIDILVDENELTASFVGNKGNKKMKTDLDAFIPGFKGKVIGFLQTHKNTPLILNIKDSTGQGWVIGDKINPAFIDTAEVKTGKKFDDNSGATIKITSNSPIRMYNGPITITPDTTTPPSGS